jgi:predicted DCC family thiol-disulfide oxidoreductase YuxK
VTAPALTIFYNTKCPVCKAGIDSQRNKLLAAVKAGVIEFRDINLEPEALASYGVSVNDVRRRLHAIDASGRLIVGADVAVAVWRETPGEAWLASILGAPGIISLTRLFYNRFADLLYSWNKRQGHW